MTGGGTETGARRGRCCCCWPRSARGARGLRPLRPAGARRGVPEGGRGEGAHQGGAAGSRPRPRSATSRSRPRREPRAPLREDARRGERLRRARRPARRAAAPRAPGAAPRRPPLRGGLRPAPRGAPVARRRFPHGDLQRRRLPGGDVRQRHPRLLQVPARRRAHERRRACGSRPSPASWCRAGRARTACASRWAGRSSRPPRSRRDSGAATDRCSTRRSRWTASASRSSSVSMGNPHAVLYVDDVDAAPVTTLGPRLEVPPRLPEPRERRVRADRSSRSGCASAPGSAGPARPSPAGAAPARWPWSRCCGASPSAPSPIELRGGELQIEWPAPDGPVFMTGPAAEVFRGTLRLDDPGGA